jgi:hypothetical protein
MWIVRQKCTKILKKEKGYTTTIAPHSHVTFFFSFLVQLALFYLQNYSTKLGLYMYKLIKYLCVHTGLLVIRNTRCSKVKISDS